MKKAMLAVSVLLGSLSAHADWSGDILCAQPRPTESGHSLLADAKGRVQMTMVDGRPVATFEMSDVRLFSEYGTVRGTVTNDLVLTGDIHDGNDSLFVSALPEAESPLIRSISFDLSSLNRGLTKVTTQRGNVYEMLCMVRED